MEDFILSFFFENYSKELLFYLLPIGYLSFSIYFYGSKKWDSFNDFDKIACTLLTSHIILNFLIIPLILLFSLISNFFYFSNETNLTSLVQNVGIYTEFLLYLLIVLAGLRFYFRKSLYEYIDFNTSIIFSLSAASVILIALSIYFSFLSKLINYPFYYEYLYPTMNYIILRLVVFLLLFSLLHNRYFHNGEITLKEYIPKINKQRVFGFFGITIIAFLIGFCLFNPTIFETNRTIEEINIGNFPVDNYQNWPINAVRTSNVNYSVTTPLALNWVKVQAPFPIDEASIIIDGKLKTCEVKNNNYFIVNNLSETYAEIIITEEIDISNELIIDLDIPDYNDDVEYYEIYFKNNCTGKILIDDIEFEINEHYRPVKVTYGYENIEDAYTHSLTENESKFFDRIEIDGNWLYVYCPNLKPDQSYKVTIELQWN